MSERDLSNKKRVVRELKAKPVLETWQKTMILSLEREIKEMEKEIGRVKELKQ